MRGYKTLYSFQQKEVVEIETYEDNNGNEFSVMKIEGWEDDDSKTGVGEFREYVGRSKSEFIFQDKRVRKGDVISGNISISNMKRYKQYGQYIEVTDIHFS